jgi:hypothetical protein
MNRQPNDPAVHAGVVPTKFSKRGVRFLIGGLAGGTVFVVAASVDDWAYLTRWLTGLAALVIVLVYILGKKWLVGRAVRLAQQNVERIHAKERKIRNIYEELNHRSPSHRSLG